MKFTCELCNKDFSTKSVLKRHVNSIHGERVVCDICGKHLSRQDKLLEHKKKIPSDSVIDKDKLSCVVCKKEFSRSDTLLSHLRNNHTVEVKTPVESKAITKFCDACQKDVLAKNWSYHVRTNFHKKNAAEPLNENLKVIKSAFEERVVVCNMPTLEPL